MTESTLSEHTVLKPLLTMNDGSKVLFCFMIDRSLVCMCNMCNKVPISDKHQLHFIITLL